MSELEREREREDQRESGNGERIRTEPAGAMKRSLDFNLNSSHPPTYLRSVVFRFERDAFALACEQIRIRVSVRSRDVKKRRGGTRGIRKGRRERVQRLRKAIKRGRGDGKREYR